MIYGEKVLRKTGTHLSALADCSAAILNMQLAAFSLGLGTCWIGLIRYLFPTDRCWRRRGTSPLCHDPGLLRGPGSHTAPFEAGRDGDLVLDPGARSLKIGFAGYPTKVA